MLSNLLTAAKFIEVKNLIWQSNRPSLKDQQQRASATFWATGDFDLHTQGVADQHDDRRFKFHKGEFVKLVGAIPQLEEPWDVAEVVRRERHPGWERHLR